ncbi:hypothetical protein D3C78_1052750 [compost metagenome]
MHNILENLKYRPIMLLIPEMTEGERNFLGACILGLLLISQRSRIYKEYGSYQHNRIQEYPVPLEQMLHLSFLLSDPAMISPIKAFFSAIGCES